MYALKEEGGETCVLRTALFYQCTATNQNIILSHDLVTNLIKMCGVHLNYCSVTITSVFYLTSSEINFYFLF